MEKITITPAIENELNGRTDNVFTKVQNLSTDLREVANRYQMGSYFDVTYHSLSDGTFVMKMKLTNVPKHLK
jgi:hypothetical protein